MEKTETSYYLGTAYMLLAIASFFAEVPGKVINAVSVGALMFSISQMLYVWGSGNVKGISLPEILRAGESKDEIALKFIKAIYEEKGRRAKSQNSFWFFASIVLKSFAFIVIIAGPYLYPFSNENFGNRVGQICTILSLAFMFFSFYLEERKAHKKYLATEEEIIDSFGITFESLGEFIKDTKQNFERPEEQDNLEIEKQQ